MTTPSKETAVSPHPSLVNPGSVSLIGAVDGQGTLQSPSYSGPAEKNAKKVEKDKGSTSKSKPSTDKPVKTADKLARSSTDSKIAELDQKWSDRFNRLEALLMAKTLDSEPTFQKVKLAPTHSPPVGVVRSTTLLSSLLTELPSDLPCDLPSNLHRPLRFLFPWGIGHCPGETLTSHT